MNAPTFASLARWHLSRLGTGTIAAPALGLLLGLIAAWSGTRENVAAAEVTAIGSALAIAFASSPSAALAVRSLFLFSAPLYGRELARALALAPCAVAALFPLAAWAGFSLLRQSHISVWLTPLLAVVLATLIALSATLRDRWRAALYRTLALSAAATLAITSLALHGSHRATATLALLTIIAGFFALRAFGETLARYDPLAETHT